jgi:hypothetical protein
LSLKTYENCPKQQVIVGPGTEDGPWYFSLNNRRLWVLKRCREEGLLEDNRIRVRVRTPKSSAEAARYSLENCALEAKIIREPGGNKQRDDLKGTKEENVPDSGNVDLGGNRPQAENGATQSEEVEDDDTSDSDESTGFGGSNPFSALS